MNKGGDKKNMKDDFYDRVNYYESRNIFSSHEPFNENLRIYTQLDPKNSEMWRKINNFDSTNEDQEYSTLTQVKKSSVVDAKSLNKKEMTQKFLDSASFNSENKFGCKKCGYGKVLILIKSLVGHYAYQCYNIKSEKKEDPIKHARLAAVSSSGINKDKIKEVSQSQVNEQSIKDLFLKRKHEKEAKKAIKHDKHKKEAQFNQIVDSMLDSFKTGS